MAIQECISCLDSFEEQSLVEEGVCRFCTKLPKCQKCAKRFPKKSSASRNLCSPCHTRTTMFGEIMRPNIPCRRCSSGEIWRRLVVLEAEIRMEQYICKGCGFTEQYAQGYSALRKSDSCQLLEINAGVYR